MTDSTLILGAGLAGLSCAHHLDGPKEIFERSDTVGGVARSFRQGEFTFDCTGHWLHLRDEGITSLVESLIGDELMQVERIAEIHSHGARTPYPFQANTHGLPTEVTLACVLGYFEAREKAARGEFDEPVTFEDFIRQRMGDGIAEHFMIPYNTKLWTVPPSEMRYSWTGRFVPLPTPEEVVRGALISAGGRGLGYNSSFQYPREGGIGRLPDSLAERVDAPIHFGAEAVAIDWQNCTVRFADGGERSYRRLVSTLPLSDLIARLVAPPDVIAAAGAKLRATTVTYWNVGVARPNDPGDAHWIYFPDMDLPFYRAGSASAAIPSLAPAGHRSYYVETSHRRGETNPFSDQDILEGMRRVGLLLEKEEPVLFERMTIDCAYVIMDDNYGPARSRLLEWLKSQGILSVGRYGSWIYDSMEGAMVQGREAASALNSD
ncbi:MAG: FAD-dependent oxidoreductase [Myxococcota bacterium]